MRPQRPASAAEVTEVEAQEPEALTALKVHRAALFIIDFNLQLAELLAKSFVHCRNQPVMSLVGVDQDHQVSGAGGSHPRALAEPDMTLSRHPAPIVRPRP